SLVGQVEGLNELPAASTNLSYNYGIIAEAAMSTVLLHLFEAATNDIKLVIRSTYFDHERHYLVQGVAPNTIDRSRILGEEMGAAINSWADGDGYAEVLNCTVNIPSEPDNWQPTPTSFSAPELPCWGNLRPFTFNSDEVEALCNPGIPEEVSTVEFSVYMNNITELVETGEVLVSEQEDIAKFWSDGPGTFTVPGHYMSVLEQLVDQQMLDGKQTVTAWAQLSIAMADTYISAYKLKYTYFRPRPISFIQANNSSGWEAYIRNPSTPEYPSLRGTMAYATTQVFANLYGNNTEFKDNSYAILNLDERIYSSFTEMAEEAAYSRVYAGTNLRSTLDASEYHGRCIAQRASELFFTE
ncbi:MAG: vanadium-dependent haloperoxidase, partial [Flavobacteriales bacterium]